MKAENLDHVTSLLAKLDEAKKDYDQFSRALTHGGKWGEFLVHIQVSNDHYGNGTIASKRMGLSRSDDGKKLIAELRDEAWSKVIDLRYQIRSLGVEL